jgi:Domain of unknown function (DUF4062)
MKVYLSSTWFDLKEHRLTAAHHLRKSQHKVVMMEEYVARDQPVPSACKEDVSQCDAYVGIFAWRYGYVPRRRKKSITEIEYLAAGKKRIPRLIFLLDEKAKWPKSVKDKNLTKIKKLRSRLKEYCTDRFSDKKDLALNVLSAVNVQQNRTFAQQINVVKEIQQAKQVGTSYIENLTEKLGTLKDIPLVEFEIGQTPWWNTRLYLLAALAEDLYRNRGFVFVDKNRRFLLLASPKEVRYRLRVRWPLLEDVYTAFRNNAMTPESIIANLWRYPQAVFTTFSKEEKDAIEVVTEHHLTYDLGIFCDAEVVDLPEKSSSFIEREIVARHTPYVALLRDGKLEGLVDRVALSQRVALAALGQKA